MLRCGAPTHFKFPTSPYPHLSLHLPLSPHIPSHFHTPPFIPLATSLLPPPTPQHIFLLSPHLPSPSQSVAKLPCDEVSVAKLLWRSYHVAKLLATLPPHTNTLFYPYPHISFTFSKCGEAVASNFATW